MKENVLPSDSQEYLSLLGTGMSALYQVATCHLGCRGGDHIIESLVGRSYNLAGGSLLMLRHGYYDESLNLTRGIGEIANLLSLFCMVAGSFEEWVSCTRNQRIRKFGPATVRSKIQATGLPCLVDEDIYRELCETATHVTPKTSPNAHDAENKRYIGGFPQTSGMAKSIDTLADMVVSVAMTSTKLVGQDELFETVAAAIAAVDPME